MIGFPVWKQATVTYWCPSRIVFSSLSSYHSMTVCQSLDNCTVILKQQNWVALHKTARKCTSCTVLFRRGWKYALAAGDKREKWNDGKLPHSKIWTCSSTYKWWFSTVTWGSSSHVLAHFTCFFSLCEKWAQSYCCLKVEETKEAAADTFRNVFSLSKSTFQI